MNITVDTSHLDAAVRRQLSVIGKRAVRKDGDSSFSVITPSSAEVDTLHDYYLDAVTLVNTSAQYFVTASTSPNAAGTSAVGEITLTFPTNHNNEMNTTITVAFTTFLVAYAVYAWLSIVEPSLVERYKAAMREKLEALVLLIFHKTPPNQGYTDSLPPMVSTPGDTLTLSPGEQQLMAYTLGSDQVDDLEILSTVPGSVTVAKNTDTQVFSILNANSGESNVSAVVTIIRTGNNEELARISVTALGTASEQESMGFVLVGYAPLSDSIAIENNHDLVIDYLGTISAVNAESGRVTATINASTHKLTIHSNSVGNVVVTLVGPSGQLYRLNVIVYAHEASIRHRNVSITEGESVTYDLPFGSASQNITVQPQGYVTFSKTSTQFTITGAAAGTCDLAITNAVGDMYIYTITVAASQQSDTLPAVFGYDSGDTINMQTGGAVWLNYYPGSRGSFTVISNDTSKVSVSNDSINHIVTVTSVAAGSATIVFTNSTLHWTLTLTVYVSAEQAEPIPPALTYSVGAPTEQNPLMPFLGYVSLRTSDDIYVKATGGSGGTLYATSSDSSKLSVTNNGTYYIIHPIAGSASVVFTFNEYTWTVANSKPQAQVDIPYIITSARNFSLNNNEYVNIDIDLGSFTTRDITCYINGGHISLSSIEDREDGTARLKVTCATAETENASFNIEFNPEDSTYYEDSWEETFYVSCNPSSPTPTPTPTVRYQDVTINVGGDVTYALPFGASAQTYQMSPTGIATFSDDMDELTITIYGNVAGSCQLAVTETDSGDQYIYRITVTSSGGGGGISPFDGLPSSGAIYGYITGTVNVDPGVNITNPVIKIDSSGNVSACCKDVSGSDYLVRYNEQTGEIEYQYARVGTRNRATPICTKAINEASDNYSVVLVEASPNYTHDNPTISFFM